MLHQHQQTVRQEAVKGALVAEQATHILLSGCALVRCKKLAKVACLARRELARHA